MLELSKYLEKSPVLVIVSVIFHGSRGQFAEIVNYTDGLRQECPALPDLPGWPPALPQWYEDCGFPTMPLSLGRDRRGAKCNPPLCCRASGPLWAVSNHNMRGWVQFRSSLRPLEKRVSYLPLLKKSVSPPRFGYDFLGFLYLECPLIDPG